MKRAAIILSTILLCIMLPGYTQDLPIETAIQTGHYAAVTSVAFSRDGKLAATGSADKTIKLWEVATGREIRSYLGNNGRIQSLVFSPAGNLLASIDQGFALKIWDVATSKAIRTIQLEEDKIISVVFADGGTTLVTGTEKNHAILWRLQDGKEIRRFTPEIADIRMQKNFSYPGALSVDVSPDNKWLLTGSNDRTVFLFNFLTGKQEKKFKWDRSSCSSCGVTAHFNRDASRIVMGNMDSVFTCETENGRLLKTMEGGRAGYGTALFSQDDTYIASTLHGRVSVWEAETGKLLKNLDEFEPKVNVLAFNPVANNMLAGFTDRISRLLKIPSAKEILSFQGYLNQMDEKILDDSYMNWVAFINEIRLSPDGKLLAVGQTGHNAKLIDFETGKVIHTLKGHEGLVISLDFSEDGKRLATGSVDGTVKIWDVNNGKMLQSLPDKTSNIPYFSVDFSRDGKLLATGSWDGRLRVWDLENSEILLSVNAHDNVSPYSVQFSQNGLYVVSSGLDRKLKLFEIDTGREILEFIGHTDVVSSIRRHPDGQHMISVGWDGRAKLWDMTSGMQVRRFTSNDLHLQALDIDKDGKYMVTGSDDNTARKWDLATGEIIQTYEGHRGTVSSVNLTPDGKFLVTGSHDGTIKTWDLESGKEILTHIFIGEDDWMVKTADGHFDASEGARKSIFFVRGIEIFEIDQFFDEFYRPGLLNESYRSVSQASKLLSSSDTPGSSVSIQEMLKESPPPSVEIYTPADRDTFLTDQVSLMVKITNMGGGIDEVRLLNNGKRIPVDNEDVRKINKEGRDIMKICEAQLVPGENSLQVSAYSEGRIESQPDKIILFYKGREKTINCYLLAIGINEYQNPALELNYAKADAKAFTKSIQDMGQDIFKTIEILTLYDKEATKDGILAALDELAAKARPEDVFLFFYAGHGSMVENNFYFIPTESVSLYQLEKLTEESIQAGIIQEKFRNIKALKQVVILDACQSGGSTELLAMRGAQEEKALAQLSRSSGVHVMASAGSEQYAAEVGSLGHGLFTYALLEALAGKADGAPKDGNVTVYELKAYINDQVPELSRQYKGGRQWPYTFSIGHDFPVVRMNE